MSTQIQYLRGSAAQLNAFTGVAAELVVNTTDWTLRVLDGTTVGGYPLVGLSQTQTLTNKTLVDPVITGTLTSLSVTGNISTSANYLGNGAALTGVTASTSNSAITAGTVTTAAQGNITSVGTLSALSVSGAVTVAGGIVNGGANGVGNIGSTGTRFNTIFATATSAQYADLAEMYCADADYAPGTVVEFGGAEEITQTTATHSTRVAGVVSTNPSYLMNATLSCNNAVEVALTGRVPCFVVGTIRKGDRMVSSNIVGAATAMKQADYEPGCIIGKALQDYNSDEVGTIEVVVGRV